MVSKDVPSGAKQLILLAPLLTKKVARCGKCSTDWEPAVPTDNQTDPSGKRDWVSQTQPPTSGSDRCRPNVIWAAPDPMGSSIKGSVMLLASVWPLKWYKVLKR